MAKFSSEYGRHVISSCIRRCTRALSPKIHLLFPESFSLIVDPAAVTIVCGHRTSRGVLGRSASGVVHRAKKKIEEASSLNSQSSTPRQSILLGTYLRIVGWKSLLAAPPGKCLYGYGIGRASRVSGCARSAKNGYGNRERHHSSLRETCGWKELTLVLAL